MARPLRIQFQGALYHVMARANGGQELCRGDSDRRALLALFGKVAQRLDWGCYAYCLMTNHYHFVIQTAEPNLSKGMQQLNGAFAQRFNRVHGRRGHLFEGRFRAHLVEHDGYLMEVVRYVVLNPVRAGRVERPEDWCWSSYRATTGQAPAPPWFWRGRLLRHFGSTRERAIARFVDYVRDGRTGPSIWKDLRQQIYIGSMDFVQRMQVNVDGEHDLGEIPRAWRRCPPKSLCWYAERCPDIHEAMARAYLSGDFTQRDIARYFGVHYATVSRWVKRLGDPLSGQESPERDRAAGRIRKG